MGKNCFLYVKAECTSFNMARQRIGLDLWYFFMVFFAGLLQCFVVSDKPECWDVFLLWR